MTWSRRASYDIVSRRHVVRVHKLYTSRSMLHAKCVDSIIILWLLSEEGAEEQDGIVRRHDNNCARNTDLEKEWTRIWQSRTLREGGIREGLVVGEPPVLKLLRVGRILTLWHCAVSDTILSLGILELLSARQLRCHCSHNDNTNDVVIRPNCFVCIWLQLTNTMNSF